jgi:hypothetical protein
VRKNCKQQYHFLQGMVIFCIVRKYLFDEYALLEKSGFIYNLAQVIKFQVVIVKKNAELIIHMIIPIPIPNNDHMVRQISTKLMQKCDKMC